jgi:ABC-type microcin C transport system permease subunit YejE
VEVERPLWQRFRHDRLGYWSLWILIAITAFFVCARFIANDRPLIIRFDGQLFFPAFVDYPETAFGGDFEVAADYRDPQVRKLIAEKSGFTVWPPIRFSYDTINVDIPAPAPSPPTWLLSEDVCRPVAERMGLKACRDLDQNWLGTDDRARDLVARVIHGVRLAVEFGLAVACIALIGGIAAGSTSCRTMRHTTAATIQALPTIFRGSIGALIVFDVIGFGVPPGWPSLGEVIRQAKSNVQAPWIATGAVLGMGMVAIFFLLALLISRALRDTFEAESVE